MSPSEPLVSVVMSMQDSAETPAPAPAIRSIQRQTLTDWERILIDDGSHDDSVKIAVAFDEPGLRPTPDTRRLGLAARLNQGVKFAHGRFITRMDADDVYFPERLAAGGDVREGRIARSRRLSRVGILRRAGGGHNGCWTHSQRHPSAPLDRFPLPYPARFGRAAWFRANPYNERMTKAQDQELLLRSARAGGDHAGALAGLARHGVKAAADVATAALDLQAARQRGRLSPVPTETRLAWAQLAAGLGLAKAGEPCAA